MTADQLRKSILQKAIQGKLVPQNPNDEPATVLLEKIKKERKILIKNGEIKSKTIDSTIFIGDDNCTYEKIGNEVKNITEEIPFELPNGWSWCRLNNIYDMYTGNSINETEKKLKFMGLSNGLNYIGTKDVNFDKSICYNNGVKIPNSDLMKFRTAKKNSVLLCIEGGSAGRKIAYTNQDVCFGNKLCCFKNIFDTEFLYLYYFLQTPYFLDNFKFETSGIIGGVSLNVLKNLLFALPPLEEQKRIVEKLEQLEPLIKEYEKYEKENAKLDKEITDKLKKSILQYAIQGKLVKQDPNNEPASVLLDRILEERVKEQPKGKKSKQALSPRIYKNSDDNCYYENGEKIDVPFDLPDSWTWCRFKNLIELKSGRDLTPAEYNAKGLGMPYITGASNIDNGSILINRWTTTPKVISKLGDLLITCKGTIGEMSFNSIGDIHIARQIMAMSTSYINTRFIRFFMLNYVALLKINAKSFIPGISREDIMNIMFPLPPLAEQEKIVATIEEIFQDLEK